VTETLETIPRQYKVIQHVREKFTCRDCETISQEPAPFHTIPRAFAGPSLLAMIAYAKYGQHQPLNRQSERFALEGLALSVSTLADLVGATCVALEPAFKHIETMVFGGARLHGDDTTVPVMARGQTDTARTWVYVRDDRPFGGSGPPCAVFYYSRDRAGVHPQTHLAGYSGIFQADAYGGYNKLYEPNRSPGPIIEAACYAHARRKFFELADIARNAKRKAQGKTPAFVAPMALAAVQRIDALFEIERAINVSIRRGPRCDDAVSPGRRGGLIRRLVGLVGWSVPEASSSRASTRQAYVPDDWRCARGCQRATPADRRRSFLLS
jgi:transposase